MKKTREIIFKIKHEFEKQLELKNSWGKNEVKALYDQVVIDVLTQYIE